MLLTAFDRGRADLYAPSASIFFDHPTIDIRKDLALDFTQVEVDLQLSVAGTFRFTIPHAFDTEKGDFRNRFGQPLMPILKLGRQVWIKMGYGDLARQKPIMSGFITAISTGFTEGGSPEIEVSGTDALYLLTIGTSEHRLENKSVKDAVTEVAQRNGMALTFQGTPPKDVTLDANHQTDLEFLGKLVEIFSTRGTKWEFYIRASETVDELVFRPRASPNAATVASLAWGSDLLALKPEINLGNQVRKVEVLGWDEQRKTVIKGEAFADKGSKGEPTGGDVQKTAFGRDSVLVLKLPVKSKEEADQRAEAAMAKRANSLLKGEGDTFGMPDLRPDTGVTLTGLGDQFSADYYVTKTVHKFDTSGYRTHFAVERPVA
jgi:uncharacterized protein